MESFFSFIEFVTTVYHTRYKLKCVESSIIVQNYDNSDVSVYIYKFFLYNE